MSKKIVHIGRIDNNFMPTFIRFVDKNFDMDQHDFHLMGGVEDKKLDESVNVSIYTRTIVCRLAYYLSSIIKIHRARKVILHGLFDNRLVMILFLMPWLLKKSSWFIWGGDLYLHNSAVRNWKWKLNEFFRHSVIRKISYLVTYIEGDYKLAKQWYGAEGQYQECLMYTSNVYKEYDVPEKQHPGVNIMVGNSADPTNNHFEVFDKLEVFKEQEIHIYVPLTYGNHAYAQEVIAEGKKRFGEKFKPLQEHMPFSEYLEFLGSIDIAIFNHNRQQAMGNAITLLGLGKKVFLRSDVSQWDFFNGIGIKVFDILSLGIDPQEAHVKKLNSIVVKNYFSEINYLKQLKGMFL